jgi:hypothetical protein
MASFVTDEHFPAEVFGEMLDWTVDSVSRGVASPEELSGCQLMVVWI